MCLRIYVDIHNLVTAFVLCGDHRRDIYFDPVPQQLQFHIRSKVPLTPTVNHSKTRRLYSRFRFRGSVQSTADPYLKSYWINRVCNLIASKL